MSIPADCLRLRQFLTSLSARFSVPPAWFTDLSVPCCGAAGSDPSGGTGEPWRIAIGGSSAIECVRPFPFLSGTGATINGVPIEKYTEHRITGIELHGNDVQLTGDLEKAAYAVADMDFLVHLELFGFKGLTGNLPAYFSKMSDLMFLVLSNNSLSGQLKGYTLPPIIMQLDLSGNNFTGEMQLVLPIEAYGPQIPSPPTFICNLSNNPSACLGPHLPASCWMDGGRNCSAAELTTFNPPAQVIPTTTSRTTTTTTTTTKSTSISRTTSSLSTRTATATPFSPSSSSSVAVTSILSFLVPLIIVGSFIAVCVCLCCIKRRRGIQARFTPEEPKPEDVVLTTTYLTPARIPSTSTWAGSNEYPLVVTVPPPDNLGGLGSPTDGFYEAPPPAYSESVGVPIDPVTTPEVAEPITSVDIPAAPDYVSAEPVDLGTSGAETGIGLAENSGGSIAPGNPWRAPSREE